MKKTIWKFILASGGPALEFSMPLLSEFLLVQMQDGCPVMWFLVVQEPGKERVSRKFEIYGTGHDIQMNRTYLGTWQEPPLVWHLFEVPGGQL